MKIDFTITDNNLQVALDGRLDTTTAPELDSFLGEHYGKISALTIDCEKLMYVSSAGLRVLLSAQKKMMGAMTLRNVGELVMEVLEMTGFSGLLNIV